MRYEVGTNVVLVDNVPLEEASPLALKGYKGLGSALMAFEQGGTFIVPHLLWHEASVFVVSSE